MILAGAAAWAMSMSMALMSSDGAGTSCDATSTAFSLPVEAIDAGFTQEVFRDEFCDLDLAPDREAAHAWYNGLWYNPPSPSEQISVSDGALKLETGQGEKGATIATYSPKAKSGGATFGFGYFEASMRWTPDPRNWAAFWLFSSEHASGTDQNRWCEIDIFENYGSSVFVGTAHDWDDYVSSRNRNHYHHLDQPIISTDWNRFGLLREPGKLTWFLNGKPLFSAASPEVCDRQQLFMVLSAQKHGGTDNQDLMVDWVRVYSTPDPAP